MLDTVYRQDQQVVVLDQTRLPGEVIYLHLSSPEMVADAIRRMQVRGAPLIGVTAALGFAQGVSLFAGDEANLPEYIQSLYDLLRSTRPTAVNLFWALDRMLNAYKEHQQLSLRELQTLLWSEAESLIKEDHDINLRIGVNGSELVKPGSRVLTVCNAGALATCGHGTALGIIRSAYAADNIKMVYACETRPVLQGARLTVWELSTDQIPVTLITDNMAAYLMQQGKVDLVVVGADRITANGDTANKIGTYMLAVLARYHNIPFIVAAPTSTIDMSLANGKQIPIEERDADEVRKIGQNLLTLPEVPVYNPAFDLTPHELITAIVTENSVYYPPFDLEMRV
ncbi:MAG: S-methyl-5-thioribose-1-phosphate isomerase [Methylocystaceae bacterium]